MTTSYHPEYDSAVDSNAQNFNNYIEMEDDDNDSQSHLDQHDHASFSSTTRNNSSASSPPNAELNATATHQSASVSPEIYSKMNVTTKFHKTASSPSLSHSLPSSSTVSPAKTSASSVIPRRKTYGMGKVEKIISITPVCYLKPRCFFVAWNSVITLVFNGWPEPIDTMKQDLESSVTVCKEFFGSKFPKITLGCVKDGVEMTPKKLAMVRRICAQSAIPKDWVLCLDSLSVVLYENRSQESIIYEKIIPLKKNHKFLGSPKPLLLDMDETDDSPFLRSANRTSHYRSLVIGSSIIHRLVHIPKFISDFQAKLPQDIYDTFSKDSMHVTIRSLC